MARKYEENEKIGIKDIFYEEVICYKEKAFINMYTFN